MKFKTILKTLKYVTILGLIGSSYYYLFNRTIVSTDNVCHIYDRRPLWESKLENIEKESGISKYTILAIIKQESSFNANAKPPRKKIFGFIPHWNRVSSSFGYSQSIDGTWVDFQKTKGNKDAERDSFEDSSKFIAWYLNKSVKINKISKTDVYKLYLSYHEGWGGYSKKSYLKKKSLLSVSERVKAQAKKYKIDSKKC
jgi:hypothetical protein